MAEDSPDFKESSKYNEAQLQIMRLHNLWVQMEEKMNNGELYKVKFLLDSVWRELFADVQRIGKKDIKKSKGIILKNLQLKKKIAENSGDSSRLYVALNERHEFLKELQDSVGKGGIYEDENERGFE